ncbi:MAG: type II toxin-antitoxin system mRNA interferase toxin, RelE/StbE family [Chloroflexi bacterium]|nr:type II toxin-antitoxin system mRNA interferase toxin, RelE/StbE family [Chloroflexota bacterium]
MPEAYALEYSEKAVRIIKKLDKSVAIPILEKLEYLASNADEVKHLALKGNLSGLYKLRVGDYRVLYSLNHEERIITVENVGHRKEVYGE